MKEMNTLYNADSAKGYEPLTSQEKEAMSDDEVKKNGRRRSKIPFFAVTLHWEALSTLCAVPCRRQ